MKHTQGYDYIVEMLYLKNKDKSDLIITSKSELIEKLFQNIVTDEFPELHPWTNEKKYLKYINGLRLCDYLMIEFYNDLLHKIKYSRYLARKFAITNKIVNEVEYIDDTKINRYYESLSKIDRIYYNFANIMLILNRHIYVSTDFIDEEISTPIIYFLIKKAGKDISKMDSEEIDDFKYKNRDKIAVLSDDIKIRINYFAKKFIYYNILENTKDEKENVDNLYSMMNEILSYTYEFIENNNMEKILNVTYPNRVDNEDYRLTSSLLMLMTINRALKLE